jgi:hypothetical protein
MNRSSRRSLRFSGIATTRDKDVAVMTAAAVTARLLTYVLDLAKRYEEDHANDNPPQPLYHRMTVTLGEDGIRTSSLELSLNNGVLWN